MTTTDDRPMVGRAFAGGTFVSRGGEGPVGRPCAYVEGPLAVARPIGEDREWMVGHVASGYSAGPFRYRSKVAARKAMREMLPLTDWTDERFMSGTGNHLPVNFLEKIRAIAAKHGAIDLYGRKVIA